MKFHQKGRSWRTTQTNSQALENAWERVCTYREGKCVNSCDAGIPAHLWKAGSLEFTCFPHQQIFTNNCMEPAFLSLSFSLYFSFFLSFSLSHSLFFLSFSFSFSVSLSLSFFSFFLSLLYLGSCTILAAKNWCKPRLIFLPFCSEYEDLQGDFFHKLFLWL